MILRKLCFKNIYFTLSLRFVAFLTFLIGIACFSFWTNEDKSHQAIHVTIPPAVDFSTLSDEEIIQYRADYAMSFSDVSDRNISFESYMQRTVVVRITSEEKVLFNGAEFCNTNNTSELTNKLMQVIEGRTHLRVFAENSRKIDKKIVVRISPFLKYGEVVKVIDAIKASSANPIVLAIEPLTKDYKIGSN